MVFSMVWNCLHVFCFLNGNVFDLEYGCFASWLHVISSLAHDDIIHLDYNMPIAVYFCQGGIRGLVILKHAAVHDTIWQTIHMISMIYDICLGLSRRFCSNLQTPTSKKHKKTPFPKYRDTSPCANAANAHSATKVMTTQSFANDTCPGYPWITDQIPSASHRLMRMLWNMACLANSAVDS